MNIHGGGSNLPKYSDSIFTHLLLTVQEHDWLYVSSFIRGQFTMNSLHKDKWRINSAGSADKVMGICLEMKTWTLTSQVDSPPWQCPRTCCIM
jgi:hypothetical protein